MDLSEAKEVAKKAKDSSTALPRGEALIVLNERLQEIEKENDELRYLLAKMSENHEFNNEITEDFVKNTIGTVDTRNNMFTKIFAWPLILNEMRMDGVFSIDELKCLVWYMQKSLKKNRR